jgi:nucleoside-diphosphate-sugar epimerase
VAAALAAGPTAGRVDVRTRAETGDLADPDRVRELLVSRDPAVVVNCAGAVVGTDAEVRRANVEVVEALLEARRRVAAPPRLIHLGSASEYGPVRVDRPVTETDPTRPISTYGGTKLEATRLVLSDGGLVLRLFNVIGAGASPSSLLGNAVRLIRAAQASGADSIELGPLDAYRDFVHAADVGEAVRAAVATDGADGQVVNIGSGRATQSRELVRMLADVAGWGGRVVEPASPPADAVPWLAADVSRAAEALGWRPGRSLRDGVRDAWTAAG